MMRLKTKNNWVNALSPVAMTILLICTACGSETTQSTLSQEQDRERTEAADIAKDYQQVSGHYISADSTTIAKVGRVASDSNSRYYFVTEFDLDYVVQSGSLVPYPSISGSFRMFDRTKMPASMSIEQTAAIAKTCDSSGSESADQCGYLYSFSGGVYDAPSKRIAIHIPGATGNGADVLCYRLSNKVMSCQWQPNSGAGGDSFNFIMKSSN